MRAPSNLHILATSAGLDDEEICQLWSEARQRAGNELGSVDHPRFQRRAQQIMIRLTEDKATDNVPPTLIPWVLFDIHMGMAIVTVRNGLKSANEHVKDYLRSKHAA